MDIIKTLEHLCQPNPDVINTTLGFVRGQKSASLYEVAKVHLISAEQSLISASVSNKFDTELRVGIGHLKAAFNSYDLYLEKGTTYFGFMHSNWDKETETELQLKISSIGLVIAILYKILDDSSNYLSWKNIALTYSTSYIENRPIAIKDWKNAIKTVGSMAIPSGPDKYKQTEYKNEIEFIAEFSNKIRTV